jgi:hypothetical protein
MQNPKVKTVSSTATVTFRNTSGSYYDMIISVQNQTISQSISITDTQGNLITENPIVLTVPAKVILKDVQVGTISFSDSNSYSIIISYLVKESANGIPYVDIDYQNGYIYTQETGAPTETTVSFTASGGHAFIPPTGKKWILRSLVISWQAAATQTDYPTVQIYPEKTIAGVLNLYYGSLSVTAGDDYALDLSRYVQSRTSTLITNTNTYLTEQTVPGSFELYDNETLNVFIAGETATATLYLSYIEVNLG